MQVLDVLEDLCSTLQIQFVRLDGQTNSNIRQNIVDRFNSRNSDISMNELIMFSRFYFNPVGKIAKKQSGGVRFC